jgi:23S rRNA (adenine2030-N6)-methyltransferase
MNYRHEFHAGNFADVFKHAVLARILVHLAEKPQPFRVIDTHAGAGLYDLSGAAARRTGEWRGGIARLQSAKLALEVRDLLEPFLRAVASVNGAGGLRFYPGSPLIALALMRPGDRLTACELEPRAAAALARRLGKDRRANAVAIDGWTALNAYIPPRERRGLVLIDPPFEAGNEFDRLLSVIAGAYKKWPTGSYLVWHPIKDRAAADFSRRLWRSGIAKLLRAELQISPPRTDVLTANGVIVINPPWRLEQELRVLLPGLAEALAEAGTGRSSVERRGD